MGHLDGRLRVDWRRVRQLCAGTRCRSDRSGRCLCSRLPAQARVADLRHRAAAAKDREPARMIERLRSLVPAVALEPGTAADQHTILVPSASLLEVCRTLRDHAELRFVLLADLTAVDWWPREPRYEVVYHLSSMTQRLRVKVAV